jgi:hypothetical protein
VKKLLAFAFLLFVFDSSLFAAQSLIELAPNEVLISEFKQERHLNGFKDPIKSKGYVVLTPKKGVIWETKEPFQTRLIINDRGITQTVQGQNTLYLPVSKFPGLMKLQSVFEASLQGDWSLLKERFGVTPVYVDGKWMLNFSTDNVGKDLQLKHIKITGARFVESVEIKRPNGDMDLIKFFGHEIKLSSSRLEVNGTKK